jgi:hypothetical protein
MFEIRVRLYAHPVALLIKQMNSLFELIRKYSEPKGSVPRKKVFRSWH